eukprot:scaffold1667_cov173-Amphora_coffeaeformis.AAC.6
MPPLMLRKVDSAGSLSSVASSPESFRKKVKSPRELPPLSIPPRRRTYSSESGSTGPPRLERSRSNSSDGGSVQSLPANTRRRTQSHGSPPASAPKTPSTEKVELDMKLQRAILQYGSSDPRVGELWNAIGNTYFRSGDLKGAVRAYKSAALCGKGPHVATAYLNLGTSYWNTLQVKKAIEYLLKGLKGFQTDLAAEGKSPMDSLEVASCYHQLGLAYSLEESYGKASTSIEQALDIRVRVLGAHSPATARTMDAAGRVQLMRGNISRALSYHEQALTILTQAGFSPVGTLDNLAAVYTAQGDQTAVVHMYVQIVHYLKSNWMTRPAPGPLRDNLIKLADAYEKVGEMRYAVDCRNEAELLG